MLTWQKTLTRSDAQQDTQGAKMPFLRLTKGGKEIDSSWFKNVFFGSLPWSGAPDDCEANVTMNVYIDGSYRGARTMILNYKEVRSRNHAAPCTHLLYDKDTVYDLEQLDLSGRLVTITQTQDHGFELRFG